MPRRINRKCMGCAELTIDDAIAQHGTEGDGCWNPSVCHRRRSHYRNREDNNRRRSKQGLVIENILPTPLSYGAVLVVVRDGTEQPIHAIGVDIWQGNQKVEAIAPQHTLGMRSREIQTYIQSVLDTLSERYGIAKFDPPPKEIPVSQCPIKECPHR